MNPFPRVFRQVKECLILKLHEIIRVLHAVAYIIVFILLYDRFWQEGQLKPMKKEHFFSIFIGLDLSPQVFGQVNHWPMLKVNEMIKVLYAVECAIAAVLFYGQEWQGVVFKVMKNDNFQDIFISFGLFPQFFWAGYGVNYIRIA